MGWLGWSFDQAMRSDCLVILLALDGKIGMLQAIYGDGSKKEEATEPLRPGALGKR